ncbi:uncharacterized protein LOC135217142 [Macrobrachium nipponense]|uniref:uncharacterized protein LOC135217142 n=1 Tax=Macrobrachium nipponense TaxID=159736 RepID=UPI0030C7F344
MSNDQTDSASYHEARVALRKWVGGFGKNVPKGQPYVLDADLCSMIFSGATLTTAVPRDIAKPLIEAIQAATMTCLEEQQDLMEDVEAININAEPMVTEEQVGGEVSGASTLPSPSPSSSSSSFKGFSKPKDRQGIQSVTPKVKKTLKKGLRPVPPAAKELSMASQPSTSSANPPAAMNPSPNKGTGTTSSFCKAAEQVFDPEAFTNLLLTKVSGVIDQRLDARLGPTQDIVNQALLSLTERIRPVEEMLSGLLHSGTPALSMMVPDASKLSPFDKENPWRLALHAPFTEGRLTIEGCGTRPIEDFELFPAGLKFPFPGFVRLAHALVRIDKVPKEMVIFPREQAQAAWVRSLSEWGCVNTKLTPHKGKYTMFVTPEGIPSPCTSKVAELTLQAVTEDKPMPVLRETEATSLLLPTGLDFLANAQATFTLGKLDPECASDLFSERLPKLPDHLVKAEFEARSRLARSINSGTAAELVASTYEDEQVFRVLTKAVTDFPGRFIRLRHR